MRNEWITEISWHAIYEISLLWAVDYRHIWARMT
jgi:hypothetical protein